MNKILKNIVTLILLILNIQVFASEKFVSINPGFESTDSSNKIYYISDEEEVLNPFQILNSKELKLASKTHLGGKTGPYWSRITVVNDSKKVQNLSLFNPLSGINNIEVYIYKDNKLIKSYSLGDLKAQNKREVTSRYSMFDLRLIENEKVTIISKISNYYIYNINWKIQTQSNYIKEENYKIFALAFFGGMTTIFFLFSYALFKIYKDKKYLILTFFFISTLIYEYGFNGMLYQLDIGINLELITALTWNSILISLILIVLFGYYFFEFKKYYKKLAIFSNILIFILMIELLVTVYAQFFNESLFSFYYIFQYIALLIPLSFSIIGFYMLFKKEVGAKYYVMGHGILLLAVFLNTLGVYNIIPYHEIYKILLPFTIIIDGLFLLLAQFIRTYDSQENLSKQKELLLEQSRFSSIGQAIGNITHQWKQPLSNLGSTVTYLETVLNHDSINLDKNFSNKLPNIQKNIYQMQSTLDDFSNYYSLGRTSEEFCPKSTLKKYVFEILSSKMILKNVSIKLDIEEKIQLNCYEHIFSNIMMILIDNSLDSFDSKESSNNIKISIFEDEDNIIIDYKDNAGGIKIKPIEKIFEYFVSSKDKVNSKSQGMGLNIVKMLVEDRLDGKIKVENIEKGAFFQIVFSN